MGLKCVNGHGELSKHGFCMCKVRVKVEASFQIYTRLVQLSKEGISPASKEMRLSGLVIF